MSDPAATAIIGRDEELDSLRAFLSVVEQRPAALLLSGEPGIGKTVLWEVVVEEARERFGRVFSCRGVEAEASFAFAGLSELLTGVLDEMASKLAPPRRRALEVALLLAEPDEQAPDAHTIGLALLDLLCALAEQRPVLVAVDDVQWLDPSSAAVLQVALRRLREERIGLLATAREAPQLMLPLDLERGLPSKRLTRISLDPLSLSAVHHLLRERLGIEPTRSELARVHETSGGNPFFALELARQGARLEPGKRLRVPESLGTVLGERIAGLPAETREVLLTAAVAGRPPIEVIVAAHGNEEGIGDALDVAIQGGVLELDGKRVRFAHPLLASICYQQAPAAKRRAVHRALADAVTEVEEQARHLALAAERPDASVADDLDGAADHAAARGATATGAELFELAAAMTPGGNRADGRRRLLRAANLHRLAGELERSVGLLEQLLLEVPPGVERADVLMELATTRRDDLPMEICDAALAEAVGDDARSARILAYRSWAHLMKAEIHSALRDARGALEKAEHVNDPHLLAVTITHLATVESRVGKTTPGLLERGAEIEERLGLRLEYNDSPRVALSRQLLATGELDRARALLEAAEADAMTLGNEEMRGTVLRSLGRIEWFSGRWEKALDHTASALELWDQIRNPHGVAYTGYVRALVETDLGRVEDARASARKGLAAARAMSDQEWEILTLGTLGRLEYALGNPQAAGEYMRELPARLHSLGYNDPTVPVWPDAIETLIALGEIEQARGYLDIYEGNARRNGSPLPRSAAARCRGLLAAAEGDVEAVEAYERALTELEGLPYPLERARTLLCKGSAHRQAKQKRLARDALEEAIAIFEELGASLWAGKAREELRRISGRRRTTEEDLTEMEERVARLAAIGRSNKEIAAELFVSVHTVGAHLSRTYRKLGIRSRSELATRLPKVLSEAAKAVTEPAKPAR